MNSIPSVYDWPYDHGDLDSRRAADHFAGKSFDEAVLLFKDNALYYQEDVMWMPGTCFTFYSKAYISYLLSDDSQGDAEGASCFFSLAEYRANEIRADPLLAAKFVETLHHLAAKQAWYEAEESIFGDFAERARKALKLIVS